MTGSSRVNQAKKRGRGTHLLVKVYLPYMLRASEVRKRKFQDALNRFMYAVEDLRGVVRSYPDV